MKTENDPPYWEADLCPIDPDNFWIDRATGERVNAATGERTPPGTPPIRFDESNAETRFE